VSGHADAVRCLVGWLVIGGLVGCAGAKDMSQGAGGTESPAPVASETATHPSATAAPPETHAQAPEVAEKPGAEPTTQPAAEAPAEARVQAPRQAVPAQLLGRARVEVEKQLGALHPAEHGWAPADDALRLQFRGGRCVAIRGHVPEDMDCLAVATWLGYENAYPLRRDGHCQWPGVSLKHRLAEGVVGLYDLATREFQISLRD
jgi:hypothetical protein